MIKKYDTDQDFYKLINTLTPVDHHKGYLRKRDDLFELNGLRGGKVRQCLKLVYDNLDHIKNNCNSTIVTAAGLPSPQSCIVACVANYFNLKCKVSVPLYNNNIKDYNRINVSLAQKFGAEIYGVKNPNTSGPENDIKKMVDRYGYFWVKFGMNGHNVTKTLSDQVENIPSSVKNIVCISGSGLSGIGIARGLSKFKNNVENLYLITLSDYFNKNKKLWYDTLPKNEKWAGRIEASPSSIPYQKLLKIDNGYEFDLTYESKAWSWMLKNLKPSDETLFWMVGTRNYDLSNIENINWHTSEHEKKLNHQRERKNQQSFNFFA